jgi:integrase
MDEAKRFLSITKDRRLYIGYVLAIHTGMRKGEILGLQWQDVDLVGKSISVRQTLVLLNGKLMFQEPKTRGSRRRIAISDFVVDALKKRKAKINELKLRLGEGFHDHDLVLCNNNGRPIDPKDINRDMKRLWKNTISKISNSMRFATLMPQCYSCLAKIQKSLLNALATPAYL